MVWIKLVLCIIIVFLSGRQIAKHGDIIAEKTGFGGLWIGLILLALITSLPELFNGISAVTIVGEPDLTVGNLLGANALNLFNLALLDIAHRNGSLLSAASQTHRLTGWFSLVLVMAVATSIFISRHFYTMDIGWIGWYTPIIVLLYLLFVRKIFLFERTRLSPREIRLVYGEESLRKAYLYFSISAAFIIGAVIWLATIGEEIALTYSLGRSFVGSLLLAFTTSLPEITVSFTAMRMGATDMAIANMIGSNLFNMAIIPITDVLYIKSPVLASVAGAHLITALAVILMTLLLIAGLRFRPRSFFRLNWYNCAVIILFLLSAYCGFVLA